jgi:hypothetical protein
LHFANFFSGKLLPASAKDISMEKSPHFKPGQCALLLIDHQVGTIQLIKNIAADPPMLPVY